MPIITPTVDTPVTIQRAFDGAPAIVGAITAVHSDACIDATCISPSGATLNFTQIALLQNEDMPPMGGPYAEWSAAQKAAAS